MPRNLPFPVDSARLTTVADGVVHRAIFASAGPWAIHVLEVDLRKCWAPVALKAPGGAVGRATTSALLAAAADTMTVAGAVNADFFLFAPPGVPVGAHIAGGRVVTGPVAQPVLAVDSAGAVRIATLTAAGSLTSGGATVPVVAWNRGARGIALFDALLGARTATDSSAIEVVLERDGREWRVRAIDTLPEGVAIPEDGAVLHAGRGAPDSLRAWLAALRPGARVEASVTLAPFHPREAVGGRPVLVRDSAIAARLDTVGRASFSTARHPRTAAGIAARGDRLLLVVVDGRQAPVSDGMTLDELAALMHALGAHDAINLDGGGSSALVVADERAPNGLRIANRPSDPSGERPVGNALGIVKRCR